MHQKHLLRFIKSKLRKEPDELVIFRCGSEHLSNGVCTLAGYAHNLFACVYGFGGRAGQFQVQTLNGVCT